MFMQGAFSKIFYAHIKSTGSLRIAFRFAEQKGSFKTVYVEIVIKIRRQKIERKVWFLGRIKNAMFLPCTIM